MLKPDCCPKILSYYFPQYHSITENDHVFGSDFCDWDLFRKQKDTTHLKSCKFSLPPTVENNHDPFGDYPDRPQTTILHRYPKKATILIVNAWDDGAFIGNMGAHDNTSDGWTVAGGSSIFYPIDLRGLSDDYP